MLHVAELQRCRDGGGLLCRGICGLQGNRILNQGLSHEMLHAWPKTLQKQLTWTVCANVDLVRAACVALT